MTTASTSTRWLPLGTPSPEAPRLFCFPHAGASAATFASWQKLAGHEIAVCPIQPPGRAERYREPAFRDVSAFVDDVVAELNPQFTGRYALFGHSMGALVVFELVRRLRALGVTPPVHVFVSGRPAPQLPESRTPLRDLPVGGVEEAREHCADRLLLLLDVELQLAIDVREQVCANVL